MQVIERKDIQLNFKHNLIEVRPDKKEAVFALLDEGKEGQTTTVEVNRIVMIYIYIYNYTGQVIILSVLQYT